MTSLNDMLEFLASPESYPEPTTDLRVIQTHVSVVAICDHYVYKVKKPVNFEFLDFSTLTKRKHFCEEEVRLNRRLTEGVYLGVIPIFKKEDGLSFEPGGETVDYAVKMHRLPSGGFLDDLVKAGLDQPLHYAAIIERLSAFYGSLPPQTLDPSYGTVESISYIIRENQKLRERFVGETLTHEQENFIARYQQYFIDTNQAELGFRVTNGWIRDVHGDLRLEHFHFHDGKLNIFDCIEFMERIRINDLVNDVAFLSMELELYGRFAASQRIYDSIAQRVGDVPNYALWRFYKVHRACVRGMVHAVAAHEEEILPADQALNQQKSKALFALATRYVALGDRPTVIVVYGGVATGKSTIAQNLSRLLGLRHLQGDKIRKELAGMPPMQRPIGPARERLYSAEMTATTYMELMNRAREELNRHQAVVLDSRFSTRPHRQLIEANFHDIRVIWIRTSADDQSRKERLAARENRATLSDARLENWELLSGTESELSSFQADIALDTTLPLEQNTAQLLEGLRALKTRVDN